jgi:phosphomannomutase
VEGVLSFMNVNALKPVKIVIHSGNGAAGSTFDAIADSLDVLDAPLEFIRVRHKPDASFPSGIPNPLFPQNHATTAKVVKDTGADFEVAFDSDFDRCFFFDETGQCVFGEYVVGLLASIFLEKKQVQR